MAIEINMLRNAGIDAFRNVAEGVFDDPIDAAAAREFLEDPRHHIAVAVEDGVVVGFVSAVHYVHPDKHRPELWINEVAVAPTHWRQGTGARMMRAVLNEAAGLGVPRHGCSRSEPTRQQCDCAPEHEDYQTVNSILEEAEPGALEFLATGVIGGMMEDLGTFGKHMAMWSIRSARDVAWTNARVLWRLQSAPFPEATQAYLAELNSSTGILGEGILLPL